jgi:hypothetical protein
MRSFSYLFFFIFLLGGLTLAQDAADLVDPSSVPIKLNQTTTPFEYDAAVLFDNGPIITLPGGGCSGGNASILDNTNGSHTLFGWGFQQNAFNWMADDFTSTEEWTIDSIKFYAYQTGATTSTITGIYVQIWNGAPNLGTSSVVWGDTVTNRLSYTSLSNNYRALITAPTDCARRIQEISAFVNAPLPAGTYWIQFAATGSAASGPWCPPITIAGQLITGDALQKTTTNPNWAPALNGTSQNGAPFTVYGEAGGSGGYSFFDNFDSYVAGQLLALQNPTDWTTWGNNPGSADDAMVTNLRAASNPNSVVFVTNDDVVKLHGDLTSGKWYTGFQMYIPTGKSGYWNILSDFTFNTGGYWAFECYFDVGGGGRFLTGDPVTNFTWTPNTWQWVEVVIDLDIDQAQFWMGGSLGGGTLVKQWQWTNGTSTGFGPLVIDATDFFGATANDEMYVDNFFIGPISLTPVELTAFGANVNAAGHVVLNWTTASEVNNQMFEIERSIEGGEFFRIGYVEGHGTTTQQQEYSYTDVSVTPGTYFYRLKQIDYIGTFEYSNAVMVDVKGPLGFELGQNYPNPFNPSTIIDFNIPEAGMVKLAVYNILGEEIALIKNEFMQPGFYQTAFNAADLPSGMYVYKLETANMVQARKMMLMK